MKRREFIALSAGLPLRLQRSETQEAGIGIMRWSEGPASTDFAVTVQNPTEATRMIVQVFYWTHPTLNGQTMRLLRSRVSVLPVVVGVPVGISEPIPAAADQIDHVDVELVRPVQQRRFQYR